jgi:hypothetical protein
MAKKRQSKEVRMAAREKKAEQRAAKKELRAAKMQARKVKRLNKKAGKLLKQYTALGEPMKLVPMKAPKAAKAAKVLRENGRSFKKSKRNRDRDEEAVA